ncbi:MAG TPA: choice-of-anchor B family protein [Gammaproteobacteria bacterium]|nr:choice-of-anchor B family protein [Gammaproteobacteria bacterium]
MSHRCAFLLLAGSSLLACEPALAATSCTDGLAGPYPCSRIDLVAHLSPDAVGGGDFNDVWGWTDPDTGREYVLLGRVHGTSFIDITDPAQPVYLGNLPAHDELTGTGKRTSRTVQHCKRTTGAHGDRGSRHDCGGGSTWRNVKTYDHYALIVSEAPAHGMQVFDLHRLRTVTQPPVTFMEDAHYAGFGNAHTMIVNEQTAYAYAVGTDTYDGGLHIVDVSDPLRPRAAGGYAADGYTHEVQCVIYQGPDARYAGHEICFASNEDTLTVLDVTDKGAIVQLARTGYDEVGYTHQGWLTADQRYFIMNDEFDERNFGLRTRTLVWDVSDLRQPFVAVEYFAPSFTIDHNNYIHDGYAFQSNYTSGLRVLDVRDPLHPYEKGFFDVQPARDDVEFAGTWSNYPFFASGIVAVNDIEDGLFLLRPRFARDAGSADLEVTLSPPSAAPRQGSEFTVTARVRNGGGETAHDVMLVVSLPAEARWLDAMPAAGCRVQPQVVRCTTAALAPGGELVYSLPAVLDVTAALEAYAMVAADEDDPMPADNRVQMTIAPRSGEDDAGGGALLPFDLLVLWLVWRLSTTARRNQR